MKKITKRMVALFLALTVLLCALPVQAAKIQVDMPKEVQKILYPSARDNKPSYVGMVMGTSKVSVRTNKPALLKVSTKKESYGIVVNVTPKKTGAAYVYVKVGKKTYRAKVVIKKYSNPVSAVKLGSTNISGSKFNKRAVYNLPYKKYANKKIRVNAAAKKGWNLTMCSYLKKGWMRSEMFKNGGTIKVTGGSGFKLIFDYMNPKTNMMQMIEVNFK